MAYLTFNEGVFGRIGNWISNNKGKVLAGVGTGLAVGLAAKHGYNKYQGVKNDLNTANNKLQAANNNLQVANKNLENQKYQTAYYQKKNEILRGGNGNNNKPAQLNNGVAYNNIT